MAAAQQQQRNEKKEETENLVQLLEHEVTTISQWLDDEIVKYNVELLSLQRRQNTIKKNTRCCATCCLSNKKVCCMDQMENPKKIVVDDSNPNNNNSNIKIETESSMIETNQTTIATSALIMNHHNDDDKYDKKNRCGVGNITGASQLSTIGTAAAVCRTKLLSQQLELKQNEFIHSIARQYIEYQRLHSIRLQQIGNILNRNQEQKHQQQQQHYLEPVVGGDNSRCQEQQQNKLGNDNIHNEHLKGGVGATGTSSKLCPMTVLRQEAQKAYHNICEKVKVKQIQYDTLMGQYCKLQVQIQCIQKENQISYEKLWEERLKKKPTSTSSGSSCSKIDNKNNERKELPSSVSTTDGIILSSTHDEQQQQEEEQQSSLLFVEIENKILQRILCDLISSSGIDWYQDTRLREIFLRTTT